MKRLMRYGFQSMVGLGYRAYGLDVLGRYRWLKTTLTWSQRQREEWRLQRLGDILEYSWTQVPFYREFWGDHGVAFRRPRHVEELQEYPILRKDIYRANSERIRPKNLDGIRFMEKATGGSTSVPVHYLLDLEQWTFMEAFHIWGWSQAGYEYGDPVGVIAGGSLVPESKTLKSMLRGLAQRRLFLYGVAMDSELAREHHGRLLRYGAEFLYGYPSVLYLFAKFLNQHGLQLPKLRAVVTTAEMMLPHYREGIQKWLGCPVFDDFGSNDGGVESYECDRHDGFHYNDLQSVLEVDKSDKQTADGKLVITNLWNRSSPFIRYENGDLVVLGSKPCPCGAPFPLISSVQGRTADILTFANGRSLSGPALTLIFGDMKIDGWQIVQTGPASLEVRICNSGDLRPEYREKILRVLNFHLHGDVEVEIRLVDRLELTKGGKWKPVLSQFGGANPSEREPRCAEPVVFSLKGGSPTK